MAYDIRSKILGDEHFDVASIYYHKGILLVNQKKKEAKINFEKCFLILEKLYSEKNIFSVNYYQKVGNLFHYHNELDYAIFYTEKELKVRLLFDDVKKTADCYKSLGDLFVKKENYQKALGYYENCAKIMSVEYGSNDEKTKECFKLIQKMQKHKENNK